MSGSRRRLFRSMFRNTVPSLFLNSANWLILQLPHCACWSPTLTQKRNLQCCILLLQPSSQIVKVFPTLWRTDGWTDGWMDGWMEKNVVLRIAYSSPKCIWPLYKWEHKLKFFGNLLLLLLVNNLGWDSSSSTITVFSTSRVFHWKSDSQRLR